MDQSLFRFNTVGTFRKSSSRVENKEKAYNNLINNFKLNFLIKSNNKNPREKFPIYPKNIKNIDLETDAVIKKLNELKKQREQTLELKANHNTIQQTKENLLKMFGENTRNHEFFLPSTRAKRSKKDKIFFSGFSTSYSLNSDKDKNYNKILTSLEMLKKKL